ncbi:unnamed protein product [Parascedosporium putredinis]|uniref:Pex N-terminal domain-containing protein n=1 Tax=Parascedosporium putredinis TaxID=1442378 RepID=A0A9P1HA35_9PEZI|nr:unnamed protein product [Parascedosporium putredinis]CAI8002246.1 unnamed protein product [Parascedosporium putredinis]
MTSNSFADALNRLSERQQERERAALVARRANADTPRSRTRARFSKLPYPLNQLPVAWDTISDPDGTRPSFRVGQLDAELLDEELLDLFKGQVGDALKYIAGGHLKDDWSDEIQLVLRAILFKLTIWDHDASYGAALQNLKYTDARKIGAVLSPPTKWQKSMYGLFTVTGKYAWSKWEDWLVNQDDGYNELSPRVEQLSRITTALSTTHSAAALASFLVFLVQGRYRTLLDRILRMRLAPPTSQVSRDISFEYQNRQLVWHAFTEFLLFILPLIGINRWRRWLSRTWRKTKAVIRSGSDVESTMANGELSFLPERTCAICYQDQNAALASEAEVLAAATSSGVIGSAQTDITNPYETIPCGCIYCFVCIATRLEREEGEGWTCLRCGETVKECKPWNGDVLEPAKPAPKTVAFSDDLHDVRLLESVEEIQNLPSSISSLSSPSLSDVEEEKEPVEDDYSSENRSEDEIDEDEEEDAAEEELDLSDYDEGF